jgi:hypothetical protein
MTGRRHPEPILRRVSNSIEGVRGSPSRLPQKALNPLWGKFERGTFAPFDLKEEMSHFVRHDDRWRRDKFPSPTPPKKIKGGDSSSQKSLVRMTIYYVFGEKLERGRSPRSNIKSPPPTPPKKF